MVQHRQNEPHKQRESSREKEGEDMITVGFPIGVSIGTFILILFRKNVELNVGLFVGVWATYGAMIYL